MPEPSERRHEVDPRTLEMLVCPLTKTRLVLSADVRSEIEIDWQAPEAERLSPGLEPLTLSF